MIIGMTSTPEKLGFGEEMSLTRLFRIIKMLSTLFDISWVLTRAFLIAIIPIIDH